MTRYAKLRAAGLCYGCQQPSAGYACDACKAVFYAREKARLARKRARGECRLCDSQARPGYADCTDCARLEAVRRQEWIAKQRAKRSA